MTETLLVLHILLAAAWLGAGFFIAFLGPRFAAAGGESAGTWLKALSAAGMKYFMPVGILTLLTGVGIVLSNDAYDWSDLFVTIGLSVIVITTLMGALINGPQGKAAEEAIDAGDFAGAGAAGKKLAMSGRIITALLIISVVMMVLKTGAA
jgi:hypothetical protein